jgi:hypothetical protein
VRCTCACCAASIECSAAIDLTATVLPLVPIPPSSLRSLPRGSAADILHVPKALLT